MCTYTCLRRHCELWTQSQCWLNPAFSLQGWRPEPGAGGSAHQHMHRLHREAGSQSLLWPTGWHSPQIKSPYFYYVHSMCLLVVSWPLQFPLVLFSYTYSSLIIPPVSLSDSSILPLKSYIHFLFPPHHFLLKTSSLWFLRLQPLEPSLNSSWQLLLAQLFIHVNWPSCIGLFSFWCKCDCLQKHILVLSLQNCIKFCF